MKMTPPEHYFHQTDANNNYREYSVQYHWVNTNDDKSPKEILQAIHEELKSSYLSAQDIEDLFDQVQTLLHLINTGELNTNRLFMDMNARKKEIQRAKSYKSSKNKTPIIKEAVNEARFNISWYIEHKMIG